MDAPVRHVSLLTAPLQTLYLFGLVIVDYIKAAASWVRANQVTVLLLALVISLISGGMMYPGNHVALRDYLAYEGVYIVYWMLLGIASSVGLGSGLHTFLLFLGPHIIRVAMRAGTCDSVDFSARLEGYWPYPKYTKDAWTCETSDQGVSTFQVVGKVMWPAFLWGVGTAIGELPPYFMARAARLSGEKLKELQELEEEEEQAHGSGARFPLMERVKMFIHEAIQRWGFWAILVAASIPNPLFDLAGITCGHFLIPFWTFFGATAVGKGVIKVSLQAMFYVVAFNPKTLEELRKWLPFTWMDVALDKAGKAMSASMSGSCWSREVASDCQECCVDLFPGEKPRAATARTNCASGCGQSHEATDLVGFLWNGFILVMCLFFLASIINASANEKLIEQVKAQRRKDAGARGLKPVRVEATDEDSEVDILS